MYRRGRYRFIQAYLPQAAQAAFGTEAEAFRPPANRPKADEL
jgi:hypothetical protein